jgi:hypothetical protein
VLTVTFRSVVPQTPTPRPPPIDQTAGPSSQYGQSQLRDPVTQLEGALELAARVPDQPFPVIPHTVAHIPRQLRRTRGDQRGIDHMALGRRKLHNTPHRAAATATPAQPDRRPLQVQIYDRSPLCPWPWPAICSCRSHACSPKSDPGDRQPDIPARRVLRAASRVYHTHTRTTDQLPRLIAIRSDTRGRLTRTRLPTRRHPRRHNRPPRFGHPLLHPIPARLIPRPECSIGGRPQNHTRILFLREGA